jgi:putative aldouronate transport system permease protein
VNDRRLVQVVLLSIPLLHMVLFGLLPIYGVTLAFKDFSFAKGLFSPWNGLRNFRVLFRNDIQTLKILLRTAAIGTVRALLLFLIPLVLVLVLDTLPWERFKIRVLLFLLFPQFISWVVTAGIFRSLFAFDGVVNMFLIRSGLTAEPVAFLTRPDTFLLVLFLSMLWRDLGLYSFLFYAALSEIDSSVFEAAAIDGAGRGSWKAVRFIKLPLIGQELVLIAGIILISFASGAFEAVFNLYNPALYPYVDIVDTYVYRTGIAVGRFSLAAAIELIKNLVNLIPALLFFVLIYRRMVQRRQLW